jgi:pimeloyl-ACP methyl ester carboxylesterase
VVSVSRAPVQASPDATSRGSVFTADGCPDSIRRMADPTFGLVHGAWHRGASWAPLVEELQRRGFSAITVDLPSDMPDAGVDAYAEQVVRALRMVQEPLILVGHSLGGLTIPVVATRRPVALLVYLCALLPDPGRSLVEQRATETDMMTRQWRETYTPRQVALPDGRAEWPDEVAAEVFYHDCPPAEIPAAVRRLRPQGSLPIRERTPMTAWPEVPAEYILCTDDRVVSPAWSRDAARRRLGVTPRELTGGHSPFLAQPGRLADLLVAVANEHGLPATAAPPA